MKSFFKALWNAPATILGVMVGLVFGYDKNLNDSEFNKIGNSELAVKEVPLRRPGLVGIVASVIADISARLIGNTVKNNQPLINLAFWMSLLTAAAVAATAAILLSFAPATFAAIAAFSVYGYSIASVAGASTLAQAGLATGLAAAATSLLVYIPAAVVNSIKGIANMFSSKASNPETTEVRKDTVLGATPDNTERLPLGDAPAHFPSPLQSRAAPVVSAVSTPAPAETPALAPTL